MFRAVEVDGCALCLPESLPWVPTGESGAGLECSWPQRYVLPLFSAPELATESRWGFPHLRAWALGPPGP